MFNPLKEKLDIMRIVLATSSKQRQNILRATGLKFEVVPSNFEEDLDKSKYSFPEYVQETAFGKVKDVWQRLQNDARKPDIIIGMDTMVCCGGKMFGKPENKEDAVEILKMIANSGIPHIVYTGVVIKYKDIYEKFVEHTKVFMRPLSEEEIFGYVETGEPMNKAGAYAIQGIGGSFVEGIEGDFNNVVGLPLCAITHRLKKLLTTQQH